LAPLCAASHIRGFGFIVLETELIPDSEPFRLKLDDGIIVEFTSVAGLDAISPHVRNLRRVRGVVARHRRRSCGRCWPYTMFNDSMPTVLHLVA
jgi:hypothetical protein